MSFFSNHRDKSEVEISKQAMEACEHLITQMGADLHDDLIQRLSVLQLSLDKLERSLAHPEESELLLIALRSEFKEAINSARKISRQLISYQSTDNSFAENMSMLCQNMERPEMGTVHFTSTGQEYALPKLSETYLLRIVQELIHNAHKHSSAWHVWIRLIWSGNDLLIEVEDDGTADSKIEALIAVLRSKHGSIKMRSQAIGASLRFEKGKNGLLVRIHCNLKHNRPQANP